MNAPSADREELRGLRTERARDDVDEKNNKNKNKNKNKNNTSDDDDYKDTFRILIATDNHLGAHERDTIRKNDSFIAFREILERAKQEKVDCLFLAGDLFDTNKPSRETLVQTINLLKEFVFGQKAVEFEVVSDQFVNFGPLITRVNFEDENVNVGLPIFAIHGNHDDPSGGDNLSAMDILSSCSLVNYFGKHALQGSNTGSIELKPVLLQKGRTKLALYGLGWIRDQRLHQMMASKGNVKWVRPGSSDDKNPLTNWFNLMLIHQNRVSHSPKNSISERFLPDWLDLVVWGHEHECLIEPQDFSGVSVSQPGSSVATSLVEAEAGTKKICLLELRPGKEQKDAPLWRLKPIDLETTRPYAFKNVSLAEQETLLDDVQDIEAIEHFLILCVNGMIEEADENAAPRVKDLALLNRLPLIRLRVDLTGGFPTVNVQKFGQKFVGKVANPADMLLFHKQKKKAANKDADDEFNEGMRGNGAGEDDEYDEDDARAGPRQDQIRIERLIRERMKDDLQILDIPDLTNALDDMVNREDNKSIKNLCEKTMKEVQRKLATDAQPADLIDEKDVKKRVEEMQRKSQFEANANGTKKNATAQAGKGDGTQTQRAKKVDEFQDKPTRKTDNQIQQDEEDELERVLLAQQKEAAQDGRARARRPIAAAREDNSKKTLILEAKKKDEDSDYEVADSEEEEEEDDYVPASAQVEPKRGRVGAPPRASAVTAVTAAQKRKLKQSKQQQQQKFDSDEDDDDDASSDEEIPDSEDEDSDFAKPAKKTPAQAKKGQKKPSSAAAVVKKVPESIVIDDSDSDSEKAIPSIAMPASGARGRGRGRGAKVLNKPSQKPSAAAGSKRGRAPQKKQDDDDESDSEERVRPSKRANVRGTQGTTTQGTQKTNNTAWGKAKKK
jgi:double-strand break repair protein MRE11